VTTWSCFRSVIEHRQVGCHSTTRLRFAPRRVQCWLDIAVIPATSAGTFQKLSLAITDHESPKTTKLYDRTNDQITLDEVERIVISSYI